MKIKSQRGAATLYVLIAALVFTSVAVALFITSSNRQRTQLEAIEQTKKIYDTNETAEQAYLKYIGSDVIPIYTPEQLLKIGSDESLTINGKIYTLNKNKTYVLKNDITFEGNYSTVQNLIQTGQITFEGQGHTITVTYNDVTSVYSASGGYITPDA